MRELSLPTSDIAHPQTLTDGSVVWVDAAIRHKLQHGDPQLGWEGDPRLEVYLGPDERLYVWRLENDGEYRLVTRSSPGTPLDERLIHFLIAHDGRRGHSPKAALDRHNASLRQGRDARGGEKLSEAADRLAYGLRRDLGYHYGGLSRAVM